MIWREREVLLKGRLWAALLRLNDWLTEEQAEWAIFEQSNVNEVGIALNQRIHEYMTFGLPLTVNTRRGPTPGAGRIPATSASSTSTTPKACPTSSSSPPGFGCGESIIQYEVQRSHHRRKTVQITMDCGRVLVAAPVETAHSKLEAVAHRIAPWILPQSPDGHLAPPRKRFVGGETLPYLGRDVRLIVLPAHVPSPGVRFDHWSFRVAMPIALDESKRYDGTKKAVVRWYRRWAEERLPRMVQLWRKRMGWRESPVVLIRDQHRARCLFACRTIDRFTRGCVRAEVLRRRVHHRPAYCDGHDGRS